MQMRRTQCRACGAEIGFIKTAAGKTCPVDAKSVYFLPDLGDELCVLPDGTAQRGLRVDEEGNSTQIGYVSHFATCPEADKFRKPRKSDRKK